MKKLVFLGLSLTFLLASCADNSTEPDPQPTPPTTSTTTPSTPPEGDDLDTSVTPEVTPETPDDDALLSPDEEFPEYSGNELSTALANSIVAGRDEEANMYVPVLVSAEDPMSEFLFPLLGFTTDDAQGFGIAVSAMSVQAYGVAAIVPVEGQEDVVLAGLQGFIDGQIQSFTNYLEDQLTIAKSARLETLENGVILMVMCENQDEIFDAIAADMLNTVNL